MRFDTVRGAMDLEELTLSDLVAMQEHPFVIEYDFPNNNNSDYMLRASCKKARSQMFASFNDDKWYTRTSDRLRDMIKRKI